MYACARCYANESNKLAAATEELALAKSDLAMACRVVENHKDETARAVRIGCENITAREKAEAELAAVKQAHLNECDWITACRAAEAERDELGDMATTLLYKMKMLADDAQPTTKEIVGVMAAVIGDWDKELARVKELGGKLAQEHENFLVAHRDNMKGTARIMELNVELPEQASEIDALSKSLKAVCQEVSEQAAAIVVKREAFRMFVDMVGGLSCPSCGERFEKKECEFCSDWLERTKDAFKSPSPRVKALMDVLEAAKGFAEELTEFQGWETHPEIGVKFRKLKEVLSTWEAR